MPKPVPAPSPDPRSRAADLDPLDRRLLGELAAATRPGVLELSRRLGVARNTVQAHLDRLQRSGVISGFGPYVDVAALGYKVLAFATVQIAQGRETEVIATLRDIPEVLEVHKTTGPEDLLCRIVARDNDHLHDILERALANPGVVRTTTTLALASPVAERADVRLVAVED
jgi:DNA-binding Lrp family transcriptional regulator